LFTPSSVFDHHDDEHVVVDRVAERRAWRHKRRPEAAGLSTARAAPRGRREARVSRRFPRLDCVVDGRHDVPSTPRSIAFCTLASSASGIRRMGVVPTRGQAAIIFSMSLNHIVLRSS
jgi:hypothetical protein